MDEELRTIQLRANWIGAVQAGCRTLGLVLENEDCIHSEPLISTPLNLTESHLPLNSAKLRHELEQCGQALLQVNKLPQFIYAAFKMTHYNVD